MKAVCCIEYTEKEDVSLVPRPCDRIYTLGYVEIEYEKKIKKKKRTKNAKTISIMFYISTIIPR